MWGDVGWGRLITEAIDGGHHLLAVELEMHVADQAVGRSPA